MTMSRDVWRLGATVRRFAASPLAQRPYAGVLHAFSGDLALAEAAYGWNFVLSLGGPVTFTNATAIARAGAPVAAAIA